MSLYTDLAGLLATSQSLPVWDLEASQGPVPGIRLEPDRIEVIEHETLVARVRVVVMVPAIGERLEELDTVLVPAVFDGLVPAGYQVAPSIDMTDPTIDQTPMRARVITVRKPIN